MQLERITKLLEDNNFKFAKTMKRYPHSYTLKDNWDTEQDFYDVVLYIRNNGYKVNFWNKEYIYFNIGKYKYWTMGNPLEQTKLINRAEI